MDTSTPSIVHVQSGQNEDELLDEYVISDFIHTVQLRGDSPDEVAEIRKNVEACFYSHVVEIEVVSSTSGRSNSPAFYWQELVVMIDNQYIAKLDRNPIVAVYGDSSVAEWGDNSVATHGHE